jgi:excisionase family DNA binding protein
MKLLTTAEARERLRIKDPRTLYRLIRSGELAAVKIGPGSSSYRISEQAISDYLRRSRVVPDRKAAAS